MALTAENVQSYPRPPALEVVPHRIRVRFAGKVIADSLAVLRVLETHHAPTYYIPRSDILADLKATSGRSFCEWKGHATYWDVTCDGAVARAAAWSYGAPTPRFAALQDHLAFYAGLMEACFVADVQVVPQPGNFYGGWVTPNLQGRIKGAPGTRHW